MEAPTPSGETELIRARMMRSVLDLAVQDVTPENAKSPTLRRLIDEVRRFNQGEPCPEGASYYNRFHTRHNRNMLRE